MSLILHQYPEIYGLPSLSPFCHKVETYLRMTGTPYSIVVEVNPLRGPRGRMPFIEVDGKVIPDSHAILNLLESTAERPLDESLTPSQRAQAFTLRRSLDEDFIRIIRYSRYVDERGWRVLSKDFAEFFPPVIKRPLLRLLRQSQIRQTRRSQLMELSVSEIYDLACEHLERYEALLDPGPFLFGDKVSTADASLYAFLECVRLTPIDVPMRNYLLSRDKLLEYCDRIKAKYFTSSYQS